MGGICGSHEALDAFGICGYDRIEVKILVAILGMKRTTLSIRSQGSSFFSC
jgi:hypothetical protein